jgi:hypothetical protein
MPNIQELDLSSELRPILEEHRATVEALIDKRVLASESKTERRVKEMLARPPGPILSAGSDAESIGSAVVRDSKFQSLQSAGRGMVQIQINRRLIETKSTVTIAPTLKPGVDVRPISPLPGPPPTVIDLIPSRAMLEGLMQFVRQRSPHAVAGIQILEGDQKAEAVITFDTVAIAPATLAIFVPASRQALRDIGQLQLVINSELLYAVRMLEEDQVLNGDGSAGHLTGLLPAVPAMAFTAGDTPIDAIARALGALAATGVVATGIVINPSDWLKIILTKSTMGDYILGSPGESAAVSVWGAPLALSVKCPVGTFLAGDFIRGAELGYREMAIVDISTEHSDFFTRNLICIRCEESVALGVRQPACFIKSTFV